MVINWFADTSQFIQGVRRSGQALQRQVRDVNNLRRSYRGLSAQARAVRGALIGLGSVAAIGQAISTIAQFEQALSTAIAISGAAASQFGALREESTRLGATTRFSARQAAEGMVFIARAGFSVSEVLSTTEDTLLLAQAGALGLGRAADIATNILTGFRLETSEAARVVDVLALAANSSNTNVDQLGEAMKFVAPVAAGLGVPLEVATSAVGALSNAGLQASVAGTGLRRVLAALEAPTVEAEKILRSLGVTVDEVRISEHGLIEVLRLLRDAGLDTGQALKFFGDRGGPAFEVLASSLDDVVRMTNALENAGGTARRIATIMDDNLNGALLRVRSAFEAIILALGTSNEFGALRATLEVIADAFRALARNIDLTITAATTLFILLSGASLSAARGLVIVAQKVGLLSAGLGVAALAAKGLVLALAVGFSVELFRQLTEEALNYKRVLESIPASPTDPESSQTDALVIDRFTNAAIGNFVALGRGLYNAAAVITEPLAASFGLAGEEGANSFWAGFNNSFSRLSSQFSEDLNRTYIEIADPALVGSLVGPPTAEAFQRIFSAFIDTSNITIATDELRDLQNVVQAISQIDKEGSFEIVDEDSYLRAVRFRGLLEDFADSLNQELGSQFRSLIETFFGLNTKALEAFEQAQKDVGDATEETTRAIYIQGNALRAATDASFESALAFHDTLEAQGRSLRDLRQQLQVSLVGDDDSAGLRARFSVLNDYEDSLSDLETELLAVNQEIKQLELFQTDALLATQKNTLATQDQSKSAKERIATLRDEETRLAILIGSEKAREQTIRQIAGVVEAETNSTARLINGLNQHQEILRSLRTPQENYARATTKQKTLLDAGLISQENSNRAVAELTRILNEQVFSLERAQRAGREAFASFVAEGVRAHQELQSTFAQDIEIALLPDTSSGRSEAAGLRARNDELRKYRDQLQSVQQEAIGVSQELERLERAGASDAQLVPLREQAAALNEQYKLLLQNAAGYQQVAESAQMTAESQALVLEAVGTYNSLIEEGTTIYDEYNERLEHLNLLLQDARISQEEYNEALFQLDLQLLLEQAEQLNMVVGSLAATAQAAGEAIGGSFGEALEKVGEVLSLVQQLINLFGTITKAVQQISQATAVVTSTTAAAQAAATAATVSSTAAAVQAGAAGKSAAAQASASAAAATASAAAATAAAAAAIAAAAAAAAAGGGGGGGGGGLLSSLLGFAEGGEPPVGAASIVGERGPELFVPRVPGTIIPNHNLDSFIQQTIQLKTQVLTDQAMALHQTLNTIALAAERMAKKISRSFSEAVVQVEDTVSGIERLVGAAEAVPQIKDLIYNPTVGVFTEIPRIQEQYSIIKPVIQTLERLQFRQSGGPVSRNQPFLVGESGPELFVPDRSGTVFPNDGFQTGEGGLNITNYITVEGDDELAAERGVYRAVPALEEAQRREFQRNAGRASSTNSAIRQGARGGRR